MFANLARKPRHATPTHGQAAHNAERPKRNRKVKPRKQCQAPNRDAKSNRKHRSNTTGVQNEPFRNHADSPPPPKKKKKSHKGNPSYNKLHAKSQHKYEAVCAFPPRWTCPRLPTDMDMSMPPPDVDLSMPLHNYGPA